MSDQTITCARCAQPFTWSSGEQAYYRERNLQSPRHCPPCRAARRQAHATTTTAPAPRPIAPAPPPLRRPALRQRSGSATLASAVLLSLGLLVIFPVAPLLAWLGAINLVALLTYGYDKSIAGGARRRVPEAILLGLALIGGSLGAAVGMLLFRHKTSKPTFLIPFGLIVLLQIGLIVVWGWFEAR